jgi:hypothetical protein
MMRAMRSRISWLMVFTVWQPAPESFEARAMPAKDGLRLNHLGHAEQARPEPGHPPAAELCLILCTNLAVSHTSNISRGPCDGPTWFTSKCLLSASWSVVYPTEQGLIQNAYTGPGPKNTRWWQNRNHRVVVSWPVVKAPGAAQGLWYRLP